MFGLDDNKKIGMGLLGISVVLFLMGFLFLFDRTLLILGNLCFIGGLYFMIGFTGMLGFFGKKGKVKYSAIFFLGFVITVFKLSFVGGLLQIYALFLLFRSFLPVVFEWMFTVPVIGPFLKNNSLAKWSYDKINRSRPNI